MTTSDPYPLESQKDHQEITIEVEVDEVEASGRVENHSLQNDSKEHLLENPWTLWYDAPSDRRLTAENWAANLKNLTTFNTVEDFWRLYNNIRSATQLPTGSNYHLFRDKIKPQWEDIANKRGGKWVIALKGYNRTEAERFWLYVVLGCIGEDFERSDEVTGCVFSMRKNLVRISIWTRNMRDQEACETLGREIRNKVGIPRSQKMEYKPHDRDFALYDA